MQPRPTVPTQPRLVVAAGLVWLAPTRLLVQRRPKTAPHGAGALELPGGKVEPGEAPRAALQRELVEEWGAAAGALPVGAIAEVLHHIYPPPGPEVLLLVYHVDAAAWHPDGWRRAIRLEPDAEVLACERDRLPVAEFLAADREFIARVQAGHVRPPPA
ncbi:MAG TPA: NUDIX domain-containing protein [Nannocystis sp.]